MTKSMSRWVAYLFYGALILVLSFGVAWVGSFFMQMVMKRTATLQETTALYFGGVLLGVGVALPGCRDDRGIDSVCDRVRS